MENETAKAFQEIAKATSKITGALEKGGSYLAKVFGSVPEDIVGVVVGDWLHEKRIRIKAKYAQRTAEILLERGIDPTTTSASPSVLQPLLQAAQDESREELAELFARLLANALDPTRASTVRRVFIDTVKSLEPLDAVILREMMDAPNYFDWLDGIRRDFPETPQTWNRTSDAVSFKVLVEPTLKLDVSEDELTLSIEALKRLECTDLVDRGTRTSGNVLRNVYNHADQERLDPSSLPSQILILSFTTWGRELMRALAL